MEPLPTDPAALPAAPRRYRASTRVRVIRGLFFGVMAVPSLGMLWGGRCESRFLHRLMTEGQVATARVTKLDSWSGRSVDYYVHASYEHAGRSYETRDRVERDRWVATNIGDPIAVTYLPSDPGSYRLDLVDQTRIDREATVTRVGALGFSLAFLLPLLIVEWVNRGSRRLLRDGQALPGTIVAIQPSSPRGIVGRPVDYVFRNLDGEEIYGRSFFQRKLTADMVPGAPLIVMYDPARRKSELLCCLDQVASLVPGRV